MAVLAQSWVFTLSHPLTASVLIDEAKELGIDLDPPYFVSSIAAGTFALVELAIRPSKATLTTA